MEKTSQQYAEWDQKYLWHPFTPHSVYPNESPLIVDRGEGNYLVDIEGNKYLDGVSSIWCNTFGHNHAGVNEALKSQIDKIAHSTLLGNSNTIAIELAKKLVEITPQGLDKVFYSDSGSTSVEVALKMAYQCSQQQGKSSKQFFVSLKNSYHGDTIGSVSVGGIDLFHERFRPMLFETLQISSPYYDAEKSLNELETLLSQRGDEIAAFVMEPGFQGAGGILPVPEGYLREARKLTKKYGVMLILDEVAVGIGRSGKMFACQHEDVVPDFLCLAKGLTAGYLPLAATMASNEVYEAFLGLPSEARTFFHGHTFTGNALASAVALKTLEIFEEEKLLEELPKKVNYFRSSLAKFENHKNIADIRTFGLAAGLELMDNPAENEHFHADKRTAMKICQFCLNKGLFLRPLGDVLVMMPTLSITEAQIDFMTDTLLEAIISTLGE